MARRCSQRERTRVHDQVVRQHSQQAGAVSLAFERTRSREVQGALAWLTGFRAGFYDAPYVWRLGTLDPQVWALGFIEGRGHRGRM
jgi:hypothetical protein